MVVKKQSNQLEEYEKNLRRSFERWEDILENGCNDPFHCDGVNLNLVRNHIISWKRQIEQFLENERENTLFSTPCPDIYYKPTPEKVPYDYMVKPDHIRSRAVEQLVKYEQDPNYCYIRDHYKEAFINGETKATKAAGLHPGKFSLFIRFQRAIKDDDLVDMRNLFRIPYEERIKELNECANELHVYLNSEHSQEDNTPVTDEFFENEYGEASYPENAFYEPFKDSQGFSEGSAKKRSLDEQIKVASTKIDTCEHPTQKEREEQLSFF